MARALPFSISGHTFTHVSGESAALAKHLRNVLSRTATEAWLGSSYEPGPSTGHQILLEVKNEEGELFAVVGLYRIQEIERSAKVSTMIAPMWPEVRVEIAPETRGPDNAVNNLDDIVKTTAARTLFWKRTCAVMEKLVESGLSMEDGSTLEFDHIRFPSESEGDPIQHQWTNGDGLFDQTAKLAIEFADGVAVRTIGWKEIDPDPLRARGSF